MEKTVDLSRVYTQETLQHIQNIADSFTSSEISDDDKKFLFINGDMSGIQKYIFDLKTSSDNAKLLRAKSFQLWALSEIISRVLEKLCLKLIIQIILFRKI